jgi:hypothetical protein
MTLKLEYTFDPGTYRHFINGHATVLHCHHYMSLTTKLAEDLKDLGGPRILRESAEDSIRPMLEDYCQKHGITAVTDRLAVGQEYYSVMGLGKIEATAAEGGGEVRILRSHVDEGWVKKFGKHNQAINHFTCGYAAAMYAVAYGKPPRSFAVIESASLALGHPEGKLIVRPA